MKKILAVLLMALALLTPTFAQGEEAVEVVVPETLFVNGINNILVEPELPIVEIEGTYYIPFSPSFLSEMGMIPMWDQKGESLSIVGQSSDYRAIEKNTTDPYLKDYKRKTTIVACDPIKVVIENNGKTYETESIYRNDWSEAWYLPLTEELVEVMKWEYYNLDNFGQFLYLYNFTVEDQQAFMEYQREINAMAKYMTIINKRLAYDRAAYYVQLVEKTSQKYEVEDRWILAIMWQESWYDESCTYINAVGMMQMLESTGRTMGVTREQLLNPAINIEVCVKYLKRDQEHYDGDLVKAIHAYNQGSFRVDKGTHKTWYYEEVAEKYGKIDKYINKKVAGL